MDGPLRDPQGIYRTAADYLSDFTYRKEFGLSQKELEEEPLDVYMANLDILSARGEIERAEQRKMEREQKR